MHFRVDPLDRIPFQDQNALCRRGDLSYATGLMSKTKLLTCNDCYFRREGLCALQGDVPCPTFRAAPAGELVPPRQARLVPLRPLATQSAAA
jgi:hypothetical protein